MEQLQWSDQRFANLPLHIYERIFANLDALDKISASYVCRCWEAAIFGSARLNHDLSIKVIRYDETGKVELIGRDMVEQSTRVFRNITLIPDIAWQRFDWKDVTSMIKALNEKYTIKSARFEGSTITTLNIPRAVHLFGAYLPGVQELELKINLASFDDSSWNIVFQTFSNLKSLTLHHGHGRVLASAQSFCRKLVSLKLIKYALTSHLSQVLNFSKLEELVVDEIDVPHNLKSLQWGYGEVYLPKLKHLTMLATVHSNLIYVVQDSASFRLVLLTPALETLVATDLARHFLVILESHRLHTLTMNTETSIHRVLSAPIRFFGSLRLGNLRRFVVQADNAWAHLPKLLSFAQMNCPQLQELVVEQPLPERIYGMAWNSTHTRICKDLTVVMADDRRERRNWNLPVVHEARPLDMQHGT